MQIFEVWRYFFFFSFFCFTLCQYICIFSLVTSPRLFSFLERKTDASCVVKLGTEQQIVRERWRGRQEKCLMILRQMLWWRSHTRYFLGLHTSILYFLNCMVCKGLINIFTRIIQYLYLLAVCQYMDTSRVFGTRHADS